MSVALSIHNPASILADRSHGNVDLVLYRLADDSARKGCFCQEDHRG